MSVRIAKALSWICFHIMFRVLAQIMALPAFVAFKLEWRAFVLGSSVVNVLPLSDFDLEKTCFSDSSYRFDRMGVIMTLFMAIILCCKNSVCLMSPT